MNLKNQILNRGFVKLSSTQTLITQAINPLASVASGEMLGKRIATQKPLDMTDHTYDLKPSVKKTIDKGVDLVSHFKKMKPLGYPGRPGVNPATAQGAPELSGLVYKGKF